MAKFPIKQQIRYDDTVLFCAIVDLNMFRRTNKVHNTPSSLRSKIPIVKWRDQLIARGDENNTTARTSNMLATNAVNPFNNDDEKDNRYIDITAEDETTDHFGGNDLNSIE
ncbi:uncharacterized protein ASCRUDRAFT_10606 [Ascoidea rubescens DSM 1968]|uniref:Uncharacterized protein n=1 Tax=Ascoidea rubescens DSM 1968 TaxID=1344418 RepID=A0A1D2V8S4_9ASCO|nr:hypothetical protein ASCRUDRAFT_10606 [Ascoidea rubescens DSM 1968]ODV57999.1 hypothetical protein ASCRUDRAFT_10606 [Ascoidea rubescens DSM 1968]